MPASSWDDTSTGSYSCESRKIGIADHSSSSSSSNSEERPKTSLHPSGSLPAMNGKRPNMESTSLDRRCPSIDSEDEAEPSWMAMFKAHKKPSSNKRPPKAPASQSAYQSAGQKDWMANFQKIGQSDDGKAGQRRSLEHSPVGRRSVGGVQSLPSSPRWMAQYRNGGRNSPGFNPLPDENSAFPASPNSSENMAPTAAGSNRQSPKVSTPSSLPSWRKSRTSPSPTTPETPTWMKKFQTAKSSRYVSLSNSPVVNDDREDRTENESDDGSSKDPEWMAKFKAIGMENERKMSVRKSSQAVLSPLTPSVRSSTSESPGSRNSRLSPRPPPEPKVLVSKDTLNAEPEWMKRFRKIGTASSSGLRPPTAPAEGGRQRRPSLGESDVTPPKYDESKRHQNGAMSVPASPSHGMGNFSSGQQSTISQPSPSNTEAAAASASKPAWIEKLKQQQSLEYQGSGRRARSSSPWKRKQRLQEEEEKQMRKTRDNDEECAAGNKSTSGEVSKIPEWMRRYKEMHLQAESVVTAQGKSTELTTLRGRMSLMRVVPSPPPSPAQIKSISSFEDQSPAVAPMPTLSANNSQLQRSDSAEQGKTSTKMECHRPSPVESLKPIGQKSPFAKNPTNGSVVENPGDRRDDGDNDASKVEVDTTTPTNVMNMWGERVKSVKPGDCTTMSYRKLMMKQDEVKRKLAKYKNQDGDGNDSDGSLDGVPGATFTVSESVGMQNSAAAMFGFGAPAASDSASGPDIDETIDEETDSLNNSAAEVYGFSSRRFSTVEGFGESGQVNDSGNSGNPLESFSPGDAKQVAEKSGDDKNDNSTKGGSNQKATLPNNSDKGTSNAAKDGRAPEKKKSLADNSSNGDSDSDDDKPSSAPTPAPPAGKKKSFLDDSSSDDSDSDDERTSPKKAPAPTPAPASAKKKSFLDDSSSDDSDSDNKKQAPVKAPTPATAKKKSFFDASSSDDSDSDNAKPARAKSSVPAQPAPSVKKKSFLDDSSDGSESEDEKRPSKKTAPKPSPSSAKKSSFLDDSSSDDSDDDVKAKKTQPPASAKKKSFLDDSDSSDSDSDDDKDKAAKAKASSGLDTKEMKSMFDDSDGLESETPISKLGTSAKNKKSIADDSDSEVSDSDDEKADKGSIGEDSEEDEDGWSDEDDCTEEDEAWAKEFAEEYERQQRQKEQTGTSLSGVGDKLKELGGNAGSGAGKTKKEKGKAKDSGKSTKKNLKGKDKAAGKSKSKGPNKKETGGKKNAKDAPGTDDGKESTGSKKKEKAAKGQGSKDPSAKTKGKEKSKSKQKDSDSKSKGKDSATKKGKDKDSNKKKSLSDSGNFSGSGDSPKPSSGKSKKPKASSKVKPSAGTTKKDGKKSTSKDGKKTKKAK